MSYVKEIPVNEGGTLVIRHGGPLRVLGLYFRPDHPSPLTVTMDQQMLQYTNSITIPPVRPSGYFLLTYTTSELFGPALIDSSFYMRRLDSSPQPTPFGEDWRALLAAWDPRDSTTQVLYRQRAIRGLANGDTCMWCGVGPFPTIETLEEHEEACVG